MLASSSIDQEVTVVIAVIVVAGVFFLGMGVYALAAPQAILRPFDYDLRTAAARAEVRGVYGGFGIAIAAVLTYAAVTPGEVRTGILITVGAALVGMAVGRGVSAVFDERTSFYPNWFYCVVEAIGAGALFWVA
ncbi:DUF4345 domain-containing protein [Mycolicibacterium fortuitum]|jgi:hypothetical protein|uniref:DUF4345 domain-containing protein n=1 Tax=Mycolicibacterium fortuitum TaxID=1766 RepID=A0AAE4V8A3_MYCFO|nr:DUF4345 domain-containing protein [Mycolicibacterium fortuitum]MCA4755153.1 DUF4345 domain-containing protein [Mycolicibacterium fortuitum]MCV7143074.1 DUF4345 domain-containing protein [Mycolicibacterium fortuitum]MDG5771074.1 DUF4345 domain-containing protein [Mycolicibacterium fortuitum]MDG5781776.1 DUF4345 domain-containing protein [Mycolicibacterium fortuitum]MDV7189094.1 DUF4345 domain-containing protein [Mycolicibacterium fortuitum]